MAHAAHADMVLCPALAYMWCLKAVSGRSRVGVLSQILASHSFPLHAHQAQFMFMAEIAGVPPWGHQLLRPNPP